MSSSDDLLKAFPSYLTDATRESLNDELTNFLENPAIKNDPFSSYDNDFFLQGDILRRVPTPGWKDGRFATFDEGNCIVLSNTCDIDTNNTRMTPLDCVLAPIFSIEKYQNSLRRRNYSENKIQSFCNTLMDYRVSNLFFLPIDEEFKYSREGKGYFVSLDKAFSLPRDILSVAQRVRSFNQFASYLFTFQISINFCRFHDKVDRDAHKSF